MIPAPGGCAGLFSEQCALGSLINSTINVVYLVSVKVSGVAAVPPGSGCFGPRLRLLPITCTDASNRTLPALRREMTWTHIAVWW